MAISCPCGTGNVIQQWATYTFSVVPSLPYTYDDIEYGDFTIKYAGETLVHMTLDNAVLDFEAGAIVWQLSQEQSGLLPVDERVRIYFDLVAYDGERSDIPPLEADVVAGGVNSPIPSEVENE